MPFWPARSVPRSELNTYLLPLAQKPPPAIRFAHGARKGMPHMKRLVTAGFVLGWLTWSSAALGQPPKEDPAHDELRALLKPLGIDGAPQAQFAVAEAA